MNKSSKFQYAKVNNNDHIKPNLFVSISAILFLIFSVAYLYLFLNHPDYQSIWFLIYSLGSAYIPLSIFIKKIPLTPTLIISVWTLLDQIKLIPERPHALLTIVVTIPILLYSWKNTKK